MFVKADNRSFQQELTQEQNQEQLPQEPEPQSGAITDDALSRVPGASPSKRKHSASSSVATNGSSRGDLDDVDLTFLDERTIDFSEDSGPVTSHQEFATSSTQSNKLGGIVESLANCQTNEKGSLDRWQGEQIDGTHEGPEVEMQETVESGAPAPEMKERVGGSTPFFSTGASDNNAMGGTIDLMDMDLDSDHQDSQP